MQRKIVALLCFVLLLLGITQISHAQELVKIKTAWLGGHETFPIWYAKEKGWDKESGLDIQLLRHSSGKEIVALKKAHKWSIASLGAVPALLGTLSEELEIIAIANNETDANAIFVPADSDILTVKGYNPSYPEIYGSPETVAKKEFLVTQGSSAHYMLTTWLRALGVNIDDVKLKFLDQRAIIGRMKNKYGDVYGLWSPFTFEALKMGFKKVAFAKNLSIYQPSLMVADVEFANKNPDQVEKFLKLYMRSVDTLRSQPIESYVTDYIYFYKKWTGITFSQEEAIADLTSHTFYNLEEQIALFDNSKGTSSLHQWLIQIVDFYDISGEISKKDFLRLTRLNNITDIYLKSIQ